MRKSDVADCWGQRLTRRNWDWQPCRPVLLSDGRNIVSICP